MIDFQSHTWAAVATEMRKQMKDAVAKAMNPNVSFEEVKVARSQYKSALAVLKWDKAFVEPDWSRDERT